MLAPVNVRPLFLACLLLCASHNAPATEPVFAGQKGETVFFVLGMLDEYGGRMRIEGEDVVEHFYCNEHVAAYVFRAYLDRLAREQGLPSTVETKWRQDCLVSFCSPDLSAFVNQFYSFSHESSVLTDQGRKQMAHADGLSYAQFEKRDRALKLAYLAGAWFRYGRDGHYKFANNASKMRLVKQLLDDTGARDVRTTSRESLPFQNEVYFQPTDELTSTFRRLPGEWAFAMADTLVGVATTDELAICRVVIEAAKRGDFEGCPLPARCTLSRFTFIPMTPRAELPVSLNEQREALADYDRACKTLRSVSDLGADTTFVMGGSQSPSKGPQIGLSRVGFSHDHSTAVVFVFYGHTSQPGACWRSVAAFASRHGEDWVLTGYSL